MNHLSLSSIGHVPPPPPSFPFGWLGGSWKPADELKWQWQPPWPEFNPYIGPDGEPQKTWDKNGSRDLVADIFPGLPAWMDVKHPTLPPPPPRNWSLEESEDSRTLLPKDYAGEVQEELTEEDYKIRLKLTRSLSEIRALHQQFHTAELDPRKCSILDFDHLVQLYSTEMDPAARSLFRAALFEFLQDDALDVCGLRNLELLIRITRDTTMTSLQEAKVLVDSFQQRLQDRALKSYNRFPLIQSMLSFINSAQDETNFEDVFGLTKQLWDILSIPRIREQLFQTRSICMLFLGHVLDLPVQPVTRQFVRQILQRDVDNFIADSRNDSPMDLVKSQSETVWKWPFLMARSAIHFLGSIDKHLAPAPGSDLVRFLNSLRNSDYVAAWAATVAHQFVKVITEASKATQLKMLNSWLLALRKCNYDWTANILGENWTKILGRVSKHVGPEDLSPFLHRVPVSQIPLLLLRHWADAPPQAHKAAESDELSRMEESTRLFTGVQLPQVDMVAQVNSLTTWTRRSRPEEAFRELLTLDLSTRRHAFSFSSAIRHLAMDEHQPRPEIADTDLYDLPNFIEQANLTITPRYVIRVRRHSALPNQYIKALLYIQTHFPALLEFALAHFLSLTWSLAQHNAFAIIARFARNTANISLTIKHRPYIESYINAHAQRNPKTALRLFNLDRRYQLLSRSAHLPKDLLTTPDRHVPIHPEQIFSLLTYTDHGAFLDKQSRIYSHNCALPPQRIILTHEIALLFANCERFTSETAFAYVWRCYDYLCGHHAPLGPMISRACLIAGVMRPMKEGRVVAVERFLFVLRVVRRVDGEGAADELDALFLGWRRKMLETKRERSIRK